MEFKAVDSSFLMYTSKDAIDCSCQHVLSETYKQIIIYRDEIREILHFRNKSSFFFKLKSCLCEFLSLYTGNSIVFALYRR